jgi:hypothetical protein
MDMYSPTLISHFVEHSSTEQYLSVKEESYIEIKGFYRPLFLCPTTVRDRKPDGPDGVAIKEVYIDGVVGDQKTFCYFRPHSGNISQLRKVVMLQLCKEKSSGRNVHALLLEEYGLGSFRRISVAHLGNYNLYEFIPTRGLRCVTFVFMMHPREIYGGMNELRNKEWKRTKWSMGHLS